MSIFKKLLLRAIYSLIGYLIAKRDARSSSAKWFPNCFGKNFLYSPLFPQADGKAYWAKYHAEKLDNPLTVNFKRFKADILKGQLCCAGSWHELNIDVPSALPYAVTGVPIHQLDREYEALLRCSGSTMRLGGLAADRFYYLPIREPGEVALKSDHNLIVAEAIPLQQKKKHPLRMVMTVFIDNFGWDVLHHIDVETSLPNISRFFSKGAVFENCYSASNWTLAGVGSIVSGKLLSSHNMFHFSKDDVLLGDGYKVLPEYFQEDGYLTFQVCGNTRKSPGYRYVKGYDRTVYRNEMPLCESLDVLYDHVRAFPERDHFVWLTIMDAHHTLAAEPDVANQLQAHLMAQDYARPKGKSPMQLGFDAPVLARYVEELKRIDFHLGMLFSFLEERYSDDDMVVALVSDHGPGCLSNDPHPLAHQKTHVAYMLRGRGVSPGRIQEITHVTDILPSLLKLASLPPASSIDGRLPVALGGNEARSFATAEIKYAGLPYEASIKDAEFEFYLKTKARVDDKGNVDIADHDVELFPKLDWSRDVIADHPELAAGYTAHVASILGQSRS
ncbi:MAG: sulfatase-like hydrolase/transferase [Alphaproteobacteria bacterium]|nr:sulfatase-like hydrolase/transferase [Alphaproteobacteria bacterium]